MSAQSPELQAQIAVWRAKCADNTMTAEEYKEAIKVLRAGRLTAAAAAATGATRRAKVKAEIPSADDMLGELGA